MTDLISGVLLMIGMAIFQVFIVESRSRPGRHESFTRPEPDTLPPKERGIKN